MIPIYRSTDAVNEKYGSWGFKILRRINPSASTKNTSI